MPRFRRWYVVVASLALLANARGDAFDPPADYYASATGGGNTLKQQLHNIIDGHSVVSYNAARTVLQVTDRDPANPNHMILAYNRQSINVAAINPNGSIPGWDNAATWNREHTWPESRLGDGGRAVSDLFNLRPAKTSINGDRGNLHFGGAFGQPFGEVSDKGSLKWYPGDADAGMIARQEFYMAVRYDGSDNDTSNLELAPNNPSGSSLLGDLERLIEWHFAAPPDSFERGRNQIIYDQYQHNRNPFTDRPEYVWSVFVNQSNDSMLWLKDAAPTVNGATSLDVDFGSIIVGGPLPPAKTIVLNKNGGNGTYYEVSASGAASSSLSGRFNAFRTGSAGAQQFNVGLNASTMVPGMKTGTVTVDNLDVTRGGGAGRGGNDGNDLVNVSLAVLSHANPSFAPDSDVDSLVYDFGVVTMGAPAPTFSFDLFNLDATPGFTAALQLDDWSGAGDVHVFSTNLATFGDDLLPAGEAMSFEASLNADTVGAFAATYTLTFSDEDLPGATSLGTLEISLIGTVEAAAVPDSADFDANGLVDGADLLRWQRGYGAVPASAGGGDANRDELVDALDLVVWKEQYAVESAATSPVPEPAMLRLMAGACLMAPWMRRRDSFRAGPRFAGLKGR